MKPSREMIEAGATALANGAGARSGVPRVTNVLALIPAHLAERFRDDAKAVLEIGLAMIPPNTFVDRQGAAWTLLETDGVEREQVRFD